MLLFSPLLPLVFLFAFTLARQAWYSHQIIDKDLKRWDTNLQDVAPAFALKEMQKLMVQYPNSIPYRVRWGFGDSGPSTTYYELYLEYFKDRWRQKVETSLVYQNVDAVMIKEVATEPEGTAHDFAHYKNVVAKRIVDNPQ